MKRVKNFQLLKFILILSFLLTTIYFTNQFLTWGSIFSFFIMIISSLMLSFFILDFRLKKTGYTVLIATPSGILFGYLCGELVVSFSHYQDGPGMAPNLTQDLLPVVFAIIGLIYAFPLVSIIMTIISK